MRVFPDLIEYTILPNIPAKHRDSVLLLLIGAMTIGLTRVAHEGKAFFLMGAFLTGLCFSTCHEVHHVWEHQVRQGAGCCYWQCIVNRNYHALSPHVGMVD